MKRKCLVFRTPGMTEGELRIFRIDYPVCPPIETGRYLAQRWYEQRGYTGVQVTIEEREVPE